MSYEAAIESAKEALKSHNLGKSPGVSGLWRQVEWEKHESQVVAMDTEVSRDSKTIHLFPSLLAKPQPEKAILRSFGGLVYRDLPAKARRMWTYKFALPTKDQVDSFQTKLKEGFKTYQSLVESYCSPIDRLVAINLANALLVNNFPIAEAVNIDVRKTPSTEQYANLKRYHSLVPLISAYCSRAVYEDYPEAFAELLANDLDSVYESSVVKELERMIESIARSLP